MKLKPLLLGLLLAAGSFAAGRYHYLSQNSVSLTNPLNKNQSTTITSPLADKKLFGDWVKDEWLFTIALPAAFVAGGAMRALKK